MQTYEILVKNRSVVGNSEDMTLVRTSIGIDQVHVLFDNAEWLEFPITVTFGHGDSVVTQSVPITPLEDNESWVAEATVTVPWEVVDENGPIRVTFQGTDPNGRHIITAKGSPLSVEEAGDVEFGSVPEDAPTPDQYQQFYGDALTALGLLNEAIAGLDNLVTFDDLATTSSHGIVRPDGETVFIEDGVIRTSPAFVLEPATEHMLGGVMPDGETIGVDEHGTIRTIGAAPIPVATRASLGGVIVGAGLVVTATGMIGIDAFTDEEIAELTPLDGVSVDGDDTEY